MKLFKSFFRPKSGAYSLVFSFVMMTTILIVASTTVENTQEKIRFFRELESSSKARLAAESATELSLYDTKDRGAGYEVFDDDIFGAECRATESDLEDDSLVGLDGIDATCETSGGYEVFARATMNTTMAGINEHWYTPIPNTGTAAPKDMCSIMDEHRNPAHVCNWNKLSFGRSVTIPLYSTMTDGSIATGSGLAHDNSDWWLKVRTPCADGSYDMDCDRFLLDGVSTDYANDNSIILWQMIGTYADGTRDVLIPNDSKRFQFPSYVRNTSYNTEIYESLINGTASTQFITQEDVVLRTDYANTSSPYHALYLMMMSSDEYEGKSKPGETYVTVELKLDIVFPLVESFTQNSIPYLEWQLESSGDTPFADTKSVLVGEGFHEAASGTYYFPHVIVQGSTEESISTFTLSN